MKEESGRIFFFSSIVLFIYFSSVFVFIILSSLCSSYFCLLYVRPFYFLLHCSLCLSSIYIFSLYPSYVCFLSICCCIPLLSFFLIFIFCLFLSFFLVRSFNAPKFSYVFLLYFHTPLSRLVVLVNSPAIIFPFTFLFLIFGISGFQHDFPSI